MIGGYQGAFQTVDGIQTQDHIFHNRPFPHDFLMILSQMVFIIIAYKDPVENQRMGKILDRFVTGFFVVTLGILWYCSSKYQVRQEQYRIIIYDVFGKQEDRRRQNQFQHIQGCDKLHFRISGQVSTL